MILSTNRVEFDRNVRRHAYGILGIKIGFSGELIIALDISTPVDKGSREVAATSIRRELVQEFLELVVLCRLLLNVSKSRHKPP